MPASSARTSATGSSTAATRSSPSTTCRPERCTNIEHLFGRPGFTFVEQDVSRFVWVPGPVDAVLHFASPASPVDYLDLPIQTLKVGSLGTHNTLGLAKAKGARFLLASTSEVYGDPEVHPQPESYWGHVNPIGPRGVYDEAKRFAEAMTMAYHRSPRPRRAHRAHLQRVRPAHAAPATGGSCRTSSSRRSRASPLTIYGDGSQTRSFCYVDDEIRGFLALLDADLHRPAQHRQPRRVHRARAGRPGARGHRLDSEIVFELDLPVDDPRQRQPDLTRTIAELGWQPEIELREGLVRTAAYFRGPGRDAAAELTQPSIRPDDRAGRSDGPGLGLVAMGEVPVEGAAAGRRRTSVVALKPNSFSARLPSTPRRGWPSGLDVSHRTSPSKPTRSTMMSTSSRMGSSRSAPRLTGSPPS